MKISELLPEEIKMIEDSKRCPECKHLDIFHEGGWSPYCVVGECPCSCPSNEDYC